MTKKLRQNQWAKAETESSWLSLAKRAEQFSFYLLILFLPTQLGKHFWPDFSFVFGQRIDYLSPTLYATDLLILILFLCIVLRKKISVHPFFSLSLLFISLSIFFSASPLAGWYFLVKFLEISFVTWYVAHLKQSRTTVVGILLSFTVIFESMLALAQTIAQGSLGGIFYFLGERAFSGATPGIANASIGGQLVLRPYATFSHPNMLAGYLVVSMLLIVYFYSSSKARSSLSVRTIQFLSLSSLILGTIGLALSLSRVGIGTWALIGVVTIVVTFRERANRMILFLILAVGTTFLITSVFFPMVVSRLFSFSFGQSLSERVILAKNAVTMIFTHPLLGVGPNNFISSLSRLDSPFGTSNGTTLSGIVPTQLWPHVTDAVILQPVHNMYLLVAAEVGIPGFFFFFLFLWYLSQRIYTAWRQSKVGEKNYLLVLGLTLFAILFSGLFDHYFVTLQQGQLLFALVIGIIFNKIRPATIRE